MAHEFLSPSDGTYEAQRAAAPAEAVHYLADVDEITPEDYDDAETTGNSAIANDTPGGEINDDAGSEDESTPAGQSDRPGEYDITPAEPDREVDDAPPPPPPDMPAKSEQPADAPRPFGVRRFNTDPQYALEPPAPGHVLEMSTAAALLKHTRFIDVRDLGDGEIMTLVELEHTTSEGKAELDVTLDGVTTTFTDNDGNSDFHIYHADESDTTRRYDPDIAAHGGVIDEDGEVRVEGGISLDELLANAEMDSQIGSGERVVGTSESNYLQELLDGAEPVTVPFTKLNDAIVEREARQLAGEEISWEEKATACVVVERAVQGTLDDPDSGYERYDEGYKFGGKTTIREPDGNFTEVDIGMNRTGDNGEELTPYIIIRHTEASPERMPEGWHYRGPLTEDRTIKYEARSYSSDPRDSRFGAVGNRNFTQSPGGARVQYTLVPYASGGVKEALLLRNFIRKPRRR
ncbi:MAG TPA: hypothetical protein VGO07_01755 [Candidatus Saccharimonadales bacterium]|jgi:hypothetical protein|nr:hypothetical protein [Candidatus Saccharimonadales bacterium]